MKIEGPGTPRVGTTRPTKRSGDRSGFLDHIQDDSESAAPTGGAKAVYNVNPLMLLQEVDDATTGGRQAMQRAESILDRLDELRLGLLNGSFPKEKLQDLVRLVQTQRAHTLDPRLLEVLDDIDLRAQVELAKLGLGA